MSPDSYSSSSKRRATDSFNASCEKYSPVCHHRYSKMCTKEMVSAYMTHHRMFVLLSWAYYTSNRWQHLVGRGGGCLWGDAARRGEATAQPSLTMYTPCQCMYNAKSLACVLFLSILHTGPVRYACTHDTANWTQNNMWQQIAFAIQCQQVAWASLFTQTSLDAINYFKCTVLKKDEQTCIDALYLHWWSDRGALHAGIRPGSGCTAVSNLLQTWSVHGWALLQIIVAHSNIISFFLQWHEWGDRPRPVTGPMRVRMIPQTEHRTTCGSRQHLRSNASK